MIEVRTFTQTEIQSQEVLFTASSNIRAVSTLKYILNKKFNLLETERMFPIYEGSSLNQLLGDRIKLEHPNDKKIAYLTIDDVRFQIIDKDEDIGSNHFNNLKECINIHFPKVYEAKKQFKKEEMKYAIEEDMEDHFEDSPENKAIFDKIKTLIDELN